MSDGLDAERARAGAGRTAGFRALRETAFVPVRGAAPTRERGAEAFRAPPEPDPFDPREDGPEPVRPPPF